MLNDLKEKKWPASPLKAKNIDPEQLKQFLRIRADYEKSAFVTEGHLEVRALGAKEFTKPIPPGECGISTLLKHSNGHIYGGTCGRNAHLFFYNPAPDGDAVADIGAVAANASIVKLAELPDGRIIGAVNEGGKQSFLLSYKPCEVLLREKDFKDMGVREIFDLPAEDQLFFSTIDPCHSAGETERLGNPLPNEHIADMVTDKSGTRLFILGNSSGIIYECAPDGGHARKIGSLDANGNFSGKLVCDADGMVYGAGLYGELFRLNPENNTLSSLGIAAPSLKGRELYNKVTAWALDGSSGVFYGGTLDGIIFQFIPQENRIVCLGKPSDQGNVRGIALSGRKVYSLVGEKGACCHLTCYDTSSRELRDLGCLLARSERPWNGYEFSSMATGRDGTVFMGENDRISHLFIYFPPV
ncbi:MAG: hypothetical protein WC082_04690 [Victivallales bacterium]